MRLVPIECVKPETFLGKTLYDDDGRVLLKKGVKLTVPLINKIRLIKIYAIYILDEYSDIEVNDIIKPELRQKSIKVVKETFNNIERLLNDKSKSKFKTLQKDEEYFSSVQDIAEDLLENILSNKNILVSLVDIKSMDNYTYQHCVNVAVLSLIIGIGMRLQRRELLNLCVGALIHDIGKVFVPKEIIKKEGPLTYEEFETIKTHPQSGYDYISKQFNVSSASKLIIKYHHERFDGKGYPEGLSKENIYKLARIVTIADVYDALTSNRSYRKALSASDALEYIMANSGSIFDYEIVKVFTRVVIPYPFGTIVELSNGDIGVVQDTPPDYPLRPKVKILKSNTNSIGNTIDLIEELSIVISKVTHDI